MDMIKKTIYSWISQRYMPECSDYNDLEVRRSCKSKKQARAAFMQENVPHAKGLVFLNPMKAIAFAREHGFPLVVKPNVSGFSRGSHFPIQNFRELVTAIFFAKFWWPTTVVEQYLEGKNYRVVVVEGELMSVIERYPPFVIGDGVSTINDLVDAENAARKDMGLYPCMHPISKGSTTKQFLAKKGMSLQSIPSKEELVHVYNKVALAPGGIVRVVDKKTIHPNNEAQFKKVLDMFDANILGIDVIFEKGIDIDHSEQQCIYLEVNSRPYLKMHDYPRYGEKEDLSPYLNELDKLQVAHSGTF